MKNIQRMCGARFPAENAIITCERDPHPSTEPHRLTWYSHEKPVRLDREDAQEVEPWGKDWEL